jgi:single-stranded DNA-binding protein
MSALCPKNPEQFQKNHVALWGGVVNIEIRYTRQGVCLARLTVETRNGLNSQFHRCTAWRELATKCARLKAGDYVQLVGRLEARAWDDPKTGQRRCSVEVVVSEIEIPDEQHALPVTPDFDRTATS